MISVALHRKTVVVCSPYTLRKLLPNATLRVWLAVYDTALQIPLLSSRLILDLQCAATLVISTGMRFEVEVETPRHPRLTRPAVVAN